MKKLLTALLMVLPICLLLTGCGNADLTLGSFEFHQIHIQMYGGEPVHLEVEKWKDDDGGIEVLTKNHGALIIGDGTYILYNQEECPLCGHVEYK
jgi:hypothetical protein